MLASFAASVRITVPKSAVLCDCACGALAPMTPTQNRCPRCGGRACRSKSARSRGRN